MTGAPRPIERVEVNVSAFEFHRPPGRLGPALRRGWPLVLVIALAGVAASLWAVSGRAPRYEATARLLVSPVSQSDVALFGVDVIRDGGDAASTPATAAVLIESERAASETARRLGGGWTTAAVLAAVDVAPIEDTRVLGVTASADEPDAAAAVATTFARASVDVRRPTIVRQLERRYESAAAKRRKAPDDDYSQLDRLLSEMRLTESTLADGGDPTLRFVEAASSPRTQTQSSPLLIVALALAGSLALGLAAAVAVEAVRRPARRESEVAAV
jgi:uncharacterized protein involved in exopolysaccharide biosynthesis